MTDNYILCVSLFDKDKYLSVIKRDVISFNKGKNLDKLYYDFINWEPETLDYLIYSPYSAASDIPLPSNYDTIFNLNDLEMPVSIGVSVIYGIINGWTPFNIISRGHKHICVLRFKTTPPKIFENLPKFEDAVYNNNQICLCNMSDFESIKTKFTNS